MEKRKMLNQIFMFLVTMCLLLMGHGLEAKTELKVVKSENVCMVTNMLFPKKQIPVQVENKTYFGCCENCKQTLTEDVNSRYAIDPVSGARVDKSSATIAAREDGTVIYFESPKTFRRFSGKESK